MNRYFYPLLLLCLVLLPGNSALAHGSVVAEDDLCIISIGYFQAHFKIYLPQKKGHKNYCEDIPWDEEVVFIMEYEHGDLGSVPVDFRVIHDVTGQGRFAQLEDVEAIDDLEAVTVFYRPPAISPDVYMALHHFEEPGQYLGIVTTEHPQTGEPYTAVFPFKVGYTRWGYIPLFILLLAAVQGGYWYLNRKRNSVKRA